MATAAPGYSPLRVSTGPRDRVFYTLFSIAMAIVVFVGFAPTYYLRSTFGNAPISPLLHVHGAIFTSWIALFVTQTVLVSQRRVDIHRKLGWVGAGIAASMLVVGYMAAINSARLGHAPAGIPALNFLTIPIFDLVTFAIFVGAGIYFRRDKEMHKRLMVLSMLAVLDAGIARWHIIGRYGPPAFYAAVDLFLIIAMAYDFVSRRKVHKAYIWGGALLVLSQPLRLMISGTAPWMVFAHWAVR